MQFASIVQNFTVPVVIPFPIAQPNVCIEHCLESGANFLKINSLRRDVRGLARNSRKNSQDFTYLPGVSINEETTLLRMMAEEPTSLISDVARLCEDAVGVVAAAHVLSQLNSEEHLHRIYLLPGATTIINGQVTKSRKGSVPIILDISQADWGFVCLSGAFQRIVMNLVGNSLKYTRSGFIQIQLSIKPASDNAENGKTQDMLKREIVLLVRDSGRGISSDFLKTKLFLPFTQESVLAPGTGMCPNILVVYLDSIFTDS
jgi:signal transduction histidine kinase